MIIPEPQSPRACVGNLWPLKQRRGGGLFMVPVVLLYMKNAYQIHQKQ